MTFSIINRIVAGPPEPGHRISFARLDGTETIELPDLYERAGRVASWLRSLGVGAGDRIGILSANRLEWVLLDLAALRLKAVVAGLEPSKFSSDGALLARYNLKLLCTDRPCSEPDVRPIGEVRRFADDPGFPAEPPPVRYEPDDVTTLRFTSGSTGPPKAIAPTVASMDATLRNVQAMFAHGPGDDLFCFLPLALQQQRFWIYSALCFGHDVTVTTYEAAFVTLPRAQPTVVMGVPAFFESAKKHIETQARKAGPGDEAVRTAARRLFGDRIRYLWTGSAPAGGAMLRFFTSCGLPIYEGYGFNEACIVSKNHPGAWKEGSVGRLLPGKHVMFDADGIISVCSDHPVTSRYEYALPGDTERVFVSPGVARSSDIGYVDEDGFLFIRGRADDVIVLDNGRKVIVRPMEDHMKASPAVEECVLFCPTQTYLVAVVSPAQEPADEQAIAARLEHCNASFGADEQISRVVIARPRFSIENGLLTNQFKAKRRQIFETYRPEILGSKERSHAR
jgi:long-subunit acyl-CoA synthetase (AMP-forming)